MSMHGAAIDERMRESECVPASDEETGGDTALIEDEYLRAGLESYLGQDGYTADAEIPSVALISKKPIRKPRPKAAHKEPGAKQATPRKPAAKRAARVK